MAIEIDRNIERIVGQFPDGSRGDHMVSVVKTAGVESFPHIVRRDNVLTGELQDMGYGITRMTAFEAAFGNYALGRERYEAWRDQHREAAISLVAQEVDKTNPEGERITQKVILEGPPIYLYPDPGYPMEFMGSASSKEGWETIDHLAETISHVDQEHFAMVDDFNGRPENVVFVDPEVSLGMLARQAGLSDLYILQPSNIHSMYLESGFTDPDEESKNKCSFLDAKFQMTKINFLLRDDMTTQEVSKVLRQALFVVVHPTQFAGQQQMMLEGLLGAMKDHPLLKTLPKQERMDLVSQLYIHVWVDDSGDVAGVTQPMWNKEKGRFEHIDVAEVKSVREEVERARTLKEVEAMARREAYANRL